MSALTYNTSGLGEVEPCPPGRPPAPSFSGAPYALRPKLERSVLYARQCQFSDADGELVWARSLASKLSPQQFGIWSSHINVAQGYLQNMRRLWTDAQATGTAQAAATQAAATQAAVIAAAQPGAFDQFMSWIGGGPTAGTVPPAPSQQELLRRELAATPPGSVSANREAARRAIERLAQAAQAEAAADAAAAASLVAQGAASRDATRAQWLAKVQAAQSAIPTALPLRPAPVAVATPPPVPQPQAADLARRLSLAMPAAQPARAPTVPRWAWVALTLGAISAALYWAARWRRRKS